MSRVAVFGGSFNPPHKGHEALCLILLEACPIDEVWIIPTYRHYFGKELASFEHRFAMCERMAAPFGPRVKVSAVERELDAESSRMHDTLVELKARHPENQYRLAIGADILQETDKWHRWEDIAALAPPLIFGRKGYPGGVLPSPPEVSSSEIRAAVRAGETTIPEISPSVHAYIIEHELYR